ncbi:CcdC protein domain-containing protein [Phenylobacterium sp.]|uniref:CcdC protein domain-containing protein n=1 Tax=Phenylobacterium sp. TaxID=1871053 RepID=UPI0025E11CC4|nr:CcdC protein domain-containing protein [Phenylobacterium sp.]MBX3486203.1 DUF1453 family protein [Phenylobacterium sp.]
MAQIPAGGGAPAYLTYLIPLVVIGIVILRNSRERRIRIERLWIAPAIIMLMTIVAFSANPPPGPVGLGLDLAAVCVGGLLGWWRARASTFTIDPATHVITSKVSPWGMLLILGIFALRYVLRSVMAGGAASAMHVTAAELTDSFLLLAVGVVSAQRIEWLIRARKLLAEARAA